MWSAPRRIAVAVVAFSLAAPGAALLAAERGEGFPEVPRLFGTFNPQPGVWSEYAVVEKDSGKRSKMRMAIVGKEGVSFWYEVLMDDDQHRNVIKMLVKGNPNDPDNIQRLIMKSGENPAMEMPKDFVAMGRKMASHMFESRSGVPAEAGADLKLETGEKREVKVPAGTFQTTLQRIVDGTGKVFATYDFDAAVLPFGVVTSTTERSTMELLAYGKDAKSLIAETPVPFAGPPGMPEGMPRGMPPGMKHPAGKP